MRITLQSGALQDVAEQRLRRPWCPRVMSFQFRPRQYLLPSGPVCCIATDGSFAIDGVVDRNEARPAWLRVARDLLHACRVEGTTIHEIARACEVHPVHLARTFPTFFGCSPGDYLRKCRVERAAAMLSGTLTPLTAVALECGYSDQSHFSNAFRRAFAVTPAE